MKFNLEKLQKLAKPLPEKERQDMEYQIENRDWLLLSVKLALRIRSLMEAQGINQSELARRMGVSPAQVTKILSGQENLGLKTIAKLEAALGSALYHIELEGDLHEMNTQETVQYTPFPIFIKCQPIERNIPATSAVFNKTTPIAFS